MRLLVLFSLALLACQKTSESRVQAAAPAATVLDPKTPVLKIGEEIVTAGELDTQLAAELAKLKREYEKWVFEARREGLERLVFKKVLQVEADKKGATVEEFMKTQIESKVPPAAEPEAQAFFQENQDKMQGQPFDAMKERILEYLTQQKRSAEARKFYEGLRTKANVQILLAEPEGTRIEVAAIGPAKGPEKAKVTIVEFSDFECPFCSKANTTIEQVMKNYQGKVRLVFRDYPLPFHQNAQKASEAGHCANEQGKFWELHDHMFGNQSDLSVVTLKKTAREKGMNGDKFDACLDSGKFAGAVAANLKAGQDAGVEGTPHFFINGRQLSGAQPYEKFKEAIDAELERAN